MSPEEICARFDQSFNERFAKGIGMIVRGIVLKCGCNSRDAARFIAWACEQSTTLYEEQRDATAPPTADG